MMPFHHQVILSLGSNLGDRYDNLMQGIRFLGNHGLSFVNCSGVYETEPVGFTEQPRFLNMVLQAGTNLTPYATLHVCQAAESDRLRKRVMHWGPRTLDVDILLFDNLRLDLPELTIPHPRMAERAFVLGPLEEMAPSIMEKWGFTRLDDEISLLIPASDVKKKIYT